MERNLLDEPDAGRTFNDPSRTFHIRTDGSLDEETKERPLGEKAMWLTLNFCPLNMAHNRF